MYINPEPKNRFGKFAIKDELYYRNEIYMDNIEDWDLYTLIQKSGKDLIKYSLYQHPTESDTNYIARLRDGYVFNFGKAIVDIFNFYLNGKDVVRSMSPLKSDPQWKLFEKDADLAGTNYTVLIDEAQKIASALGAVGMLVNKPQGVSGEGLTKLDEMKYGVYPYYSLYSLQNIFDWVWTKSKISHRRVLTFLKLRESDGTFTIWTPESWEQWRLDPKTNIPKRFNQGINPLGEIPFCWMKNLTDLTHPEIGVSDLIDISRIVTSIAQNLSCGEEMIKLAGFPIRREPQEQQDLILQQPIEDTTSNTGPRAVETFDPTFGKDGKPDWMPTEILEPVDATLKWIDRKTDEIYRIAHLSGVHGQRKSNNEVSSGMAIRYEFSQLNAVMNAKAINQTEAELQCIRYWVMWQRNANWFDQIEIKRATDFSIDEMAIALDNAITSMANVASRTFRCAVQKKISGSVLPDMTQEEKAKVVQEIESNTPEKIDIDFNGKNSTDSNLVRNAIQSNADHSKDE